MSEFIYYPDKDVTIVLLNNFGTYGQNIWSTGMGISCILFNLPYDNWQKRNEISVDKSVLKMLVGTYELNKKSPIQIKLADNKLQAKISGLPDIQLHAESENSFYFEDFNTSLLFTKDKMVVHEHGKDSDWAKKN